MDCRTALLTILDQVDYTNGACRMNEMIGAILPKEVILMAREAINNEKCKHLNRVHGDGNDYCADCGYFPL